MIPIEVLVGVILAIQKTYGDEEDEDEDKDDKKNLVMVYFKL